jgi:hypothetical protein
MATLAIVMFVGITVLAHAYKVVPNSAESGISQLGRAVFGGTNLLYYLPAGGTTLILVLAANTAYADFPRLASIVARDRYLPRQFMNQGDRLAFSNGILVLSLFAAILIVAFRGDTQSLLPLYMIGVFVSFTLSQAGMVIHWRKLKEPGWKTSAMINGFGALVTGVVLIIVAVTKTLEGAWIVLLLIPTIVAFFKATHRHYDHVASELTLKGYEPQRRLHNTVLIPDRRPPAGRGRSAPLCRDPLRRCAGDLCRRESGPDRTVAAGLDGMGRTCGAGRTALALPVVDGAAPRIYRAGGRREEQRLRHGDPAGIRAEALVAAPLPQPDVPAHQGCAAVPAQRRRYQRAVPSVEID